MRALKYKGGSTQNRRPGVDYREQINRALRTLCIQLAHELSEKPLKKTEGSEGLFAQDKTSKWCADRIRQPWTRLRAEFRPVLFKVPIHFTYHLLISLVLFTRVPSEQLFDRDYHCASLCPPL